MSAPRVQPVSEGRYHPLLPTTKEAKDDKTSFYSDHLPVMSEIPVDDTKLKVLSWNVYIPNIGSGFDVTENGEDAARRSERSIDAIAKMITEQSPDVILLQETYFDKDKLQKKLAELGWGIDAKDKDTTTVTLFDTKKLEKRVIEEKAEARDPEAYQPLSIQTSLFKIKSAAADVGNAQVMVHNVHFPHADFPNEAESCITSLLQNAQAKYGNVIVAGDFNNRYAPLGKAYLPNNVVSDMYRADIDMQGTDFTDGFFMMSKDKQCHQPAKMDTLDPATGRVCPVPQVKPGQASEKQNRELTRFRPILSCAVECAPEHRLDQAQFDELKAIGAFYGRVANAFNSQKKVVHFPPKINALEHLHALDKCLPLLSSANPAILGPAWECFQTHIDCERAAMAAEKENQYHYENPIIREVILECKKITDKNRFDKTIKDAFFKAKILSCIDNVAAQVGAMQFAMCLIDLAPKFAVNCFMTIDNAKFAVEQKALLVRRLTIAHTKAAINDLHLELQQSKGFMNTSKRGRISSQVEVLNTFLENVTSADVDVANILQLVSVLPLRKGPDDCVGALRASLDTDIAAVVEPRKSRVKSSPG